MMVVPKWKSPILYPLIALLLAPVFSPTATAEGLPQAPAESVEMSAAHLAKLDGLVQQEIEERSAPGAVILAARSGKVVYRKAFGHRALQPSSEVMTPATIFDMASLTKVMATATSIMILVEEGEVALSDPVADYIPEFAQHGKESITLHQMLTHFSGLRPDIDLDEEWSGYETAVARGCDEKLVALPGTRFIYSDINFFLLGEVVRRVSGQPLDQFSSERIFQPLGMNDTTFNPAESRAERIAPSERRDGKMLRGSVHDPTASRMSGVAGHAGLFSTIDDTALFCQMILNGGHYQGVRILSPLAVRQMTRNQSPPGMNDWRGFGFDIRSRFSSNRGDLFPIGSFGHTGFTGTSIWLDPTTQTFVLIFSSRLHPDGGGGVVSLRKRVASVVAASILDLDLSNK